MSQAIRPRVGKEFEGESYHHVSVVFVYSSCIVYQVAQGYSYRSSHLLRVAGDRLAYLEDIRCNLISLTERGNWTCFII